MPIKFFAVPALDPGEVENDLNRFVRTHRSVSIERKLIVVAERPVWCLCVEYVENGSPVGSGGGANDPTRNRIDYKQVLAPADFAVFSRLRELRKQIAEHEGVPVYAVLTNEQLAGIAQKRPSTSAELQQVDGIGEGKVGRYGDRVLELLATLPKATEAPVA